MNYEQYYQKGGTYVMPAEIFNELLEENQQLKKIVEGVREERDYLFNKISFENQQLKEQYCERTDCSGRLGNSKKVEELIKENEKLNHYKLLYQKVKERNKEALILIEKILKQAKEQSITITKIEKLYWLLKGDNE